MIDVINLTKDFAQNRAVDNISFSVEKGEALGFLGPNGAGKSTTMRMIIGYIPPTEGSAVIGGHDILKDPMSARKKTGYLPENAPVYPDMTVFEYLDFCARIRGFKGPDKKKSVEEAIEKCFLPGVKRQAVSTLSKGFKQRVCFAQSIIHDPEYLILDEPTDGLDPNQKHEVRMMIREMSRKKAIILSTHILDEADSLCSRAIIISNGRIVADDTPENLKKRSPVHGAARILLDDTQSPEKILACLRETGGVKSAEIIASDQGGLEVQACPEDSSKVMAENIMASLSEKNLGIKSIFIQRGKLDEVFRNLTT